MAFDERICNRIREALAALPDVEEKYMFGGVCFMVNGKMCVGVIGDAMMCRIDPAKEDEELEHTGCRPMNFTGRPMRGYVYVDETGMRTNKEFRFWIDLCLNYNPIAKSARKKK